MAKKKAAKAKKTEAKKGPVVCFFFYGSIDELGDELAKFAEKSNLGDSIVAAASAIGVTTTK